MDQVFLSEIFKGLKNLDGKPSDETQRNSLEIVVLDEFVQVDGKKLERDDKMLSKHAVVFYPDDVVRVIWVIFFQMQQYFELDSCLMLELLLVSNNLDCNYLSCLMINAL